ncbi:hypothetical protein I6F31_05135 [Bradyrhizobium sp. NBAIM01]|nr:hypothetical protein [Bradyrhizobium sp. NBAIM01]
MTSSSFALIAFSVSFNALAQIALRKAMLTVGPLPCIGDPLVFIWACMRNIYLWGGLACYAFSVLLWLAVLSGNQVSVAYPLLSIGYVVAILLSFLLLGEAIPLARLVGIALICVGVVLSCRAG